MKKILVDTRQADVDRFLEENLQTSEDFGKAISLESFGIDEKLGFREIRELLSRGLCLKIQAHERNPKTTQEKIERLQKQLANLQGQK